MSQTLSPETPVAVDVDSLLEAFGAPTTFEIALPNGGGLTFKGFGSYAEKKAFEKDKLGFVKQLLDAKAAAVKAGNNDLLPAPFRELGDLVSQENVEAAFTLHRLCLSPGFTPVDALRLTKATHLISYVMDQITWYSSNFLVNLKNELYGEAKKD